MNWKLAAIHDALMAYGPRVLFCAVVLVGIYGIGKLMKAWVTSRKKPIEKNPDVKFLEGAMDEDAPRKPIPGYTYADFQRDLHDKGLTFNEIYEKCGGVFPKKPEEGQFGPQGHQGPVQVDGQWGLSGAQGYQGFQGPDSQCSPRMKELQEWFKERGKKSHVGALVPPPPNPYPVIHKIYIRGRR